ncbi:hypothetical protein VOM14_18975 [Paraburkholderia sp. MPAMCS5]|uniref:hypothetical protein n=1 Tax=Paraburkholderia sp. MPAMCS5 TaxID=3112563 RepID=UPI002E186C3E|nr:hypothetical protein [Paraburkholderia sp. MPAMCS5]
MNPRSMNFGLVHTNESDEMRSVRRARRLLVRRELLTKSEFCCRAGVSPFELVRRLRKGTVFAVVVGRRRFFPLLFIPTDRTASRLARVTRSMMGMKDPWARYFELTYPFESLDGKTLAKFQRRGNGLRVAIKYARALAGD